MQASPTESIHHETGIGSVRGATAPAAALVLLLALGACGEGTAPPPAVPLAISTTVSARVAPASVGNAGGPAVGAASGDRSLEVSRDASGSITATDSEGNELTVDLALLLVEGIRLRPRGVASCGDGESCERVNGALLLRVPLDGSVRSRGPVGQMAATVYEEVQFRLRPATASDTAVVDSFPGLEGSSVLVEGTYNGESFTYTASVSTRAELSISPPMDLSASPSAANLTLSAPVSGWFLGDDQTLVDPRAAGGGVAEKMATSLAAFPDMDADGNPDPSGPFGGS